MAIYSYTMNMLNEDTTYGNISSLFESISRDSDNVFEAIATLYHSNTINESSMIVINEARQNIFSRIIDAVKKFIGWIKKSIINFAKKIRAFVTKKKNTKKPFEGDMELTDNQVQILEKENYEIREIKEEINSNHREFRKEVANSYSKIKSNLDKAEETDKEIDDINNGLDNMLNDLDKSKQNESESKIKDKAEPIKKTKKYHVSGIKRLKSPKFLVILNNAYSLISPGDFKKSYEMTINGVNKFSEYIVRINDNISYELKKGYADMGTLEEIRPKLEHLKQELDGGFISPDNIQHNLEEKGFIRKTVNGRSRAQSITPNDFEGNLRLTEHHLQEYRKWFKLDSELNTTNETYKQIEKDITGLGKDVTAHAEKVAAGLEKTFGNLSSVNFGDENDNQTASSIISTYTRIVSEFSKVSMQIWQKIEYWANIYITSIETQVAAMRNEVLKNPSYYISDEAQGKLNSMYNK